MKFKLLFPALAALLWGCQSTKFDMAEVPVPEVRYAAASVIFGTPDRDYTRTHLTELQKQIIDNLRGSRVFEHVFHNNRSAPIKLFITYTYTPHAGDGEVVGKALLTASTLGVVPTSIGYTAEVDVQVLNGPINRFYTYSLDGKHVNSLVSGDHDLKVFDALLSQFLREAILDGSFNAPVQPPPES